jgi:hypothetical protein
MRFEIRNDDVYRKIWRREKKVESGVEKIVCDCERHRLLDAMGKQ